MEELHDSYRRDGAIIVIVIIVGAILLGIFVVGVSKENSTENKITRQHDRFARCIEMEYERDFCLALVD